MTAAKRAPEKVHDSPSDASKSTSKSTAPSTAAADAKRAEREGAEARKAAETLETSAAKAQNAPVAEVEDGDRDENLGKVRGRDIDPTFHDEHFVDPHTGEVIENVPVIHDVAVGVNKDGSLRYEKADKVFMAQTKK